MYSVRIFLRNIHFLVKYRYEQHAIKCSYLKERRVLITWIQFTPPTVFADKLTVLSHSSSVYFSETMVSLCVCVGGGCMAAKKCTLHILFLFDSCPLPPSIVLDHVWILYCIFLKKLAAWHFKCQGSACSPFLPSSSSNQ